MNKWITQKWKWDIPHFFIQFIQKSGTFPILFFYPKAFTSGCTIEVCDFQSYFNKFKNIGFQLIGISKDSLEKNIKFAEKYKIKYFLASDETNVCEKLGVWIQKSMYGRKYFGIEKDKQYIKMKLNK